MWNTVIGGLIALVSVFVVKLWEDRRDSARWGREASRRFHDSRAKAYANFLAAAANWASRIANWEYVQRDPVPPSQALEPLDIRELNELLVPIEIFGSSEAAQLADDVIDAIWSLARSDGESYNSYHGAKVALLRQVRIDLDLAPDDEA